MSSVASVSKIELNVTLALTEVEARALAEMTKYGIDAFLQGYYKQLGKNYMQPHEVGMRLFFESINSQLPQHIRKVDEARIAFNK